MIDTILFIAADGHLHLTIGAISPEQVDMIHQQGLTGYYALRPTSDGTRTLDKATPVEVVELDQEMNDWLNPPDGFYETYGA